MFGYIRPLQGELKVRELQRFEACYCGLCHTLGKKYGIPARFILNYELVFLSMLLWGKDEQPDIRHKRCIASLCRRKPYCASNEALDRCAGYSVILTFWKLRDAIADEPFFKAISYRVGAAFLRRAYKKASLEFPVFNGRVMQEMVSLTELEQQEVTSLDEPADKFAMMLKAAAPENLPKNTLRPLLELLYHLGRWIYIIDACDDFSEDAKKGRFNPVASVLGSQKDLLTDEDSSRLKLTLTHSNNLLCAAFELLPENVWSETVRNMIYLGMPDACTRVLEGDWPPRQGKFRRHRINKEWA